MKQLFTLISAFTIALSAQAVTGDFEIRPVTQGANTRAHRADATAATNRSAQAEAARARHLAAIENRTPSSALRRVKDTSTNPDTKYVTYLEESFACLKNGSPEAPVKILLDSHNCIPVSLIGEEHYGYGGDILAQAGGAVYIYNDDAYGFMFTPEIDSPAYLTVTFKAMSVGENESEYVTVLMADAEAQTSIDDDFAEITHEWEEYTFNLKGYSGKVFLEIYSDWEDIVVKDFKVVGTTMPIHAPVATPYTNFTGDAFDANWQPVEGATGYYLTVSEWDDEKYVVTRNLLYDKYVEGTSYHVTDVVNGKIYYYSLQATDGRNYSMVSNEIKVAALAVPQNVTAAFSDDASVINISWDAVPGATRYQVQLSKEVTATEDRVFDVADADFSTVDAGGATIAVPYEPEEYVISPEELSTWSFVAPLLADGAIGVTYEMLYDYFGYPAAIQSPRFDLSGATDSKVTISMDAASTLESQFQAVVASYDSTLGGYAIADYYISQPIDAEFANQTFTLTGVSDDCFIDIRPIPDSYDMGNLYLKNLKVSIDMQAGAKVTVLELYMSAGDNKATCAIAAAKGVKYFVSVYAIQEGIEEGEAYTRLTSYASRPVEVYDASGIEDVAADAASPVFYNLQGVRVNSAHMLPGIYIRCQGDTVTKILVR